MNPKYTYLLIDVGTVLGPLLFSFDKRVQFYKLWRYVLPSIVLTGLAFGLWDAYFTYYGVWWFAADKVFSSRLLGLPFEEWMFFLTVPYSCMFLYACVCHYSKSHSGSQSTRVFSWLWAAAFAVLAFLFYEKLYTSLTFGLVSVSMLLHLLLFPASHQRLFWVAFLVSLIPFLVVNGLLTAIPVVLYNDAENLGLRLWTIPIEDIFYGMALLLLNVTLFEWLRRRTN
jgi:lycopene cyclase domain-containing protein